MKKIRIGSLVERDVPILGIPIYIGRPTALGNPFSAPHDGTKAEVVRMFVGYLEEELKEQTPARILFEAILRIARHHDITLMCWCRENPCHATVIRRALVEHRAQGAHTQP